MFILKKTTLADLQLLFEFQTDSDANLMAAFTPENPNDKEAYLKKWTGIVNNPAINMQSIWVDGELVGSVIHFDMMGETNVSYWLNKAHWHKSIASAALQEFVKSSSKRPLYGRVAFDNFGSQRVLEKSGFVRMGSNEEFANARGTTILEYIYKLK